jgi:hypothetical protein
MKITKIMHLTLASALVCVLSACGGGSSTPTAAPVPTPVATPKGKIALKVINGSTGAPIAAASVTVGGQTVTTDAQGLSTISNVEIANRVGVVITAPTFAEGLGVTAVAESATSNLVVKLLPLGTTGTIDNAVGGTVSVPNSTAKVILPANAFNATGSVTVQVTPINPSLDASIMPGDFTTANGTQNIESFGALIVSPKNSAGQAVNLAAGKTAIIRIPAVSKSAALASTIPLFYVDTATGSWIQEGTATLAGTAPNQYYEGTVSHFSTWNADRALDTVTYASCVVDTLGVPVSGVRVSSDGIDYIGLASSVTDAAGNFTVAMKKSATAAFTGSKGADLLTNTVSKSSSTANFSSTTCLILAPIANSIKIKLTWGQNPNDLDSYLFTPRGDRINFSNRGSLSAAPFANLDVDDTSSYGPEIVTINRLMVGTYNYGIHLYSGAGTITTSPTQVEVNIGGNIRIFTPPAGEQSFYPYLAMFNLTVASNCAVTVTPVNTWMASRPSATTLTTPSYCVAP